MNTLNIACMHSGMRRHSHSQAVLESVLTLLPTSVQTTTLNIGDFPYYNEDIERDSLPESILHARQIIAPADAIIIVTSEFNHGVPGVLKNALDWLSRPVRASCMANKAVFFLSQSTGALGGVRAQYQLRETLSSMLCKLVPLPEMVIPAVAGKIQHGRLTDETTRQFIAAQLAVFLAAL